MKRQYEIGIVVVSCLLVLLIGLGYYLFKSYGISRKQGDVKEAIFEGKSYKLPSGWFQRDYEEYGEEKLNIYNANIHSQAIIAVVPKSDFEIDTNIVDDASLIEKTLKEAEADVRELKIISYKNINAVVFKYYTHKKMLLAYIPAYDDYLYAIKIISGRIEGKYEVQFFDYDTLEIVIDILSTGQNVE